MAVPVLDQSSFLGAQTLACCLVELMVMVDNAVIHYCHVEYNLKEVKLS